MNSDGDSLMELKLLRSDDKKFSAPSSRNAGSFTKQAYDFKNLISETTIDAAQKFGGSRQPGQNARMRKRQIEQEFQKRKSEENTSMGAILFATSSFSHNGDVESGIKEATGQHESLSPSIAQKSSILEQISSIFRTQNKKQQIHRLEPVRTMEDDDSDLSFLSTPQARTPSKSLNFSGKALQHDETAIPNNI